MRAIAYLRVSTDDQKLGPLAQRDQIQAYAHSQGHDVVASFADLGVSGATPLLERPGLSTALAFLRSTKTPVALIVAKRDRLARDVLLSCLIHKALPKHAVILSADNTGNGASASDQLMRTLLDAMAEYERALIKQRTKSALAQKKAKGERTGSIPFGYRLAHLSATLLLPDAHEQQIIARARLLHSQKLSHRQILKTLTLEGYTSRSGNPFVLSQIQRFLLAPNSPPTKERRDDDEQGGSTRGQDSNVAA